MHGSSLYGLNHADSDTDIYIVTEHGPARQKIFEKDGKTTDLFVIGLDDFLMKVNKGTHQAIEALNSRIATYADGWEPYFKSMRVYSPLIEETYDRTIRHLIAGDTYKKRRHAVRLMYNLIELRRYGTFDPKLNPAQIEVANRAGHFEADALLELIQEELERTRVRAERKD